MPSSADVLATTTRVGMGRILGRNDEIGVSGRLRLGDADADARFWFMGVFLQGVWEGRPGGLVWMIEIAEVKLRGRNRKEGKESCLLERGI